MATTPHAETPAVHSAPGHWLEVLVVFLRLGLTSFGGPVAHGYLSLSLVAAMVMELGVIPPDAATGLNYGLDKVRFIAPVRAGARVRMRATLASVEPQNGGRMLLKLQSTLEIKGEAKPALVAELLCMLIGKRDASS